MSIRDEAAIANERMWNAEVEREGGYTVPWLEIDAALLREYVEGKHDVCPVPLQAIFPISLLAAVEDKDVLCLASGGGQQSAVLSLLGARVTVADLSEGQLQGDRRAAAYYGYEVTTLHADMRDLSALNDDSFDLVFQAASMCYVPDIAQVFSEVARVLKPGGIYRVSLQNPATFSIKWDGEKYYIGSPYRQRMQHRDDGGIEHRHDTADIFNGLLDAGLSLQRVYEERDMKQQDLDAQPGTWTHESAYVGGAFVIVARKGCH